MTIIEGKAEVLDSDYGKFPQADDPRWSKFLGEVLARGIITDDGTMLRSGRIMRGMGPPNHWLMRIEVEDAP
jgi:hypothetical protein